MKICFPIKDLFSQRRTGKRFHLASLRLRERLIHAKQGVFLKGNGSTSFTYISPGKSGIRVEGEAPDAGVINVRGSKHLVVARNNGSVLLFVKTK